MDINKIAKLSALHLAKEHTQFRDELSSILEWIKSIQDVNTDNIDPLIYVTKENIQMFSDEVSENLKCDIHDYSKHVKCNYLTVPKVIK
ncbi:MAG: aspartyl/glutamyl-tRNA amidotransferase subunit C [Proteobacteria bacterium]|nr:aspartyl/glutamyl-tRNA amidotransferase subunit C [Pseudomonadota bacterium]